MTDRWKPRPYQERVAEATLSNIELGRKLTIGLAAPGVGKQGAGIYTGIMLVRAGFIDLVITFVPRLNLVSQYELDYEGPYLRQGKKVSRDRSQAMIAEFDSPKLNHLEHTPLGDPIIPEEWKPPFGIVACYASLVRDMGPDGKGYFRALARQFEGRFLLHLDEAQFCGVAEYGEGDSVTGGVRAGAYAEELSKYAFHVLMQTGTESRADGQELILCGDRYADPRDKKEERGPLIADAECGYGEAREGHFLREFEVDYIDDHVDLKSLSGTEKAEYELSSSSKYLGQVISKPKVWQPLADAVVKCLRQRQKIWPGYKGLICCSTQRKAEEVRDYLVAKYPGLRDRILIAVSGKPGEAQQNLRAFRADDRNQYDILITVRMAFIGYDCKPITVVGILTNYRDHSHLFQMIGRALRVVSTRCYDEQVCYIIAPKDPLMCKFIDWLKEERKKGIHAPGAGGEGPSEPAWYVDDAYATGMTADGIAGPVDNPSEFEKIERIRSQLGMWTVPVTKLKQFTDAFVLELDVSGEEEGISLTDADIPPKTKQELIKEINSEVRQVGVTTLGQCGILAGHPKYDQAIQSFYEKVANHSFYSGDVNTPERAQRRLEAAEKVSAEARKRGSIWW